jgi:hypothetical protein
MRCIIKDIGPMKTNCAQTKTILLLLGAAMFTVGSAHADTWDLLTLRDGVYFTSGIANAKHGLFGLITDDESRTLEIWGRTSP